MNPIKQELLKRTKNYASEVWKLCQKLPNEYIDYKRQLVRSSSSVGANYRASCRAKSTKDFINKLKIVEEELDETQFFIELISELSKEQETKWKEIYQEGDEILAIIVKSINTTKHNYSYNS